MPHRDTSTAKDRDQRHQDQKPDSSEPEELAEVCARLANICACFSRQRMVLPPTVLDTVGRVSKLPIGERITATAQLNRELIEYLHAAGRYSGIRQ